MGNDHIKCLAQSNLLLDARDGPMLLKFLHQFLRSHLITLRHVGDPPGKFVVGNGDILPTDDFTQNEVQLHLITRTLTGCTQKLFLMGAKFLLTDSPLLIFADNLLEDCTALLLHHRGGCLHRHQSEELLHHFATD